MKRFGTLPAGCFVPDSDLCLRIFDGDNNVNRFGNSTESVAGDGVISIPRLRSNLEIVWDSVLALHRRFRGDMTGFAPGLLKAVEATRAMTALHAANCDAFASRLVALISNRAREPAHTPDRLRQLESRLQQSNQTQSQMGITSAKAGSPKSASAKLAAISSGISSSDGGKDSESVGGVTLHRAPRLVRDSFEREHGRHLFFMDFIIGADSARLCTALIPRLASAVCDAIIRASRATSPAAFTDAVLEARLHAKLLCIVLHLPNWAHSSAALSATNGNAVISTATAAAAAPLPKRVRMARAAMHGVSCEAVINIGGLVDAAVASGEPAAITVTVAVVADVIRFSAVDPVSRVTAWFRQGVAALSRCLPISESLRSIVKSHVAAADLLQHGKKDINSNDNNDSMTNDDGDVVASPDQQDTPAKQGDNGNTQMPDDVYANLFADARLMRALNPSSAAAGSGGVGSSSSTGAAKNAAVSEKQKSTPAVRRITPIAQEGGSDLVMKDAEGGGRGSASCKANKSVGGAKDDTNELEGPKTETRTNHVDGSGVNDDDNDDDDDDEGDTEDDNSINSKSAGIIDKLEMEFFSRVDGRVLELVSIVAAAEPDSALAPREAFLNVVNVLYPKTPVTVAAVAAGICAKRSGRSSGKRSRRRPSDGEQESKAVMPRVLSSENQHQDSNEATTQSQTPLSQSPTPFAQQSATPFLQSPTPFAQQSPTSFVQQSPTPFVQQSPTPFVRVPIPFVQSPVPFVQSQTPFQSAFQQQQQQQQLHHHHQLQLQQQQAHIGQMNHGHSAQSMSALERRMTGALTQRKPDLGG